MVSRTCIIGSTSGLHARPAAVFAKAAAESGLKVTIRGAGGSQANAASLLSLLTLGAQHGEEVELSVEGEGEYPVLEALSAMLTSNLDR